MAITNLERIKMEIGMSIPDDQYSIYLEEEGLIPSNTYDPQFEMNKRKLLMTTLAILNSIANNPSYMKNYKEDDITISMFAENLQNRIEQIEHKIRMLPVIDQPKSSSTFFLFNN